MPEARRRRPEGKKIEKKESGCYCLGIVLCIALIIGLDIVAGFVGLQAETAQQQVKHKRVAVLECKAPSKTAFWLGIVAVSCLVAAHIIAMLIGCSMTNLIKSSTTLVMGKINVACLSLNWFIGFAAAGLLGMGIWTNRDSRSKCGLTNKHFLSWGGKLCFLHAIASILLYLSTILARNSCCL